MSALKSLAEAKEGQRLSFAYYGGENPGTTRQVDVEEVKDDRIIGTDVDKQETRQYLFEKAAIVVVIDQPQPPIAAEAVCDVEHEYTAPTTRVRRMPMSFPAARDLLHQQIDALNGEDLAEVLAEVQGEDRARFDATSGQVMLERDVLIPHCVVNQPAHDGIACIDWLNEDGVALSTAFLVDNDTVLLQAANVELTAEEFIKEIAQHLGLTVS